MNIIKPEWRTSTVLEMCRSMRETQDYSALPILADALQDADCDDDALLTCLRTKSCDWLEASKIVALLLSPDAAASLTWLEEFAQRLPNAGYYDNDPGDPPPQEMNFAVMMKAARDFILYGEYLTEWGSDNWRTEMRGQQKTFWAHYLTVTGLRPQDDEWGFFSCSC